jgi:hypothetical protein
MSSFASRGEEALPKHLTPASLVFAPQKGQTLIFWPSLHMAGLPQATQGKIRYLVFPTDVSLF